MSALKYASNNQESMNLMKNMEHIKQTHFEILNMKNMFEMRNVSERIKSKLHTKEEEIIEF